MIKKTGKDMLKKSALICFPQEIIKYQPTGRQRLCRLLTRIAKSCCGRTIGRVDPKVMLLHRSRQLKKGKAKYLKHHVVISPRTLVDPWWVVRACSVLS
jgi:hypothetical protein